jgi:hypothetical protein
MEKCIRKVNLKFSTPFTGVGNVKETNISRFSGYASACPYEYIEKRSRSCPNGKLSPHGGMRLKLRSCRGGGGGGGGGGCEGEVL